MCWIVFKKTEKYVFILLSFIDSGTAQVDKIVKNGDCFYISMTYTGSFLYMRPANEGQRYIVTSSLIGWAHIENDPYCNICSPYSQHIQIFKSRILNDACLRLINLDTFQQDFHGHSPRLLLKGPSTEYETRPPGIDLFRKSQNAPVPYPTMLHSEQQCAHFCSEWNIVGYRTGAFWVFVN